jgi:hypothetical protein
LYGVVVLCGSGLGCPEVPRRKWSEVCVLRKAAFVMRRSIPGRGWDIV